MATMQGAGMHRWRRTRSIALGMAAGLLMWTAMLPVARDDTDEGEADQSPSIAEIVIEGRGELTVTPEELEDIEAHVDQTGGGEPSEHEMLVRSSQGQVQAVAGWVWETYPELYVEHGLGPVEEVDAWFAFTTEPPQPILDVLATLPIDVHVRWGYPANAQESEAALDRAVSAVAAAIGDGAPIVGSLSTDSIEIRFGWDEPAPSEAFVEWVEQAASEAAASSSDAGDTGAARLPVDVVFDPALAGDSIVPEGGVDAEAGVSSSLG